MKSNLVFDKNRKLLRIPVLLKHPRKRIKSEFVFDTGCPYTTLNYSDSVRLGIPHNKKGELIRLGGKVYQSYIFNNFEIIFKTSDDQIVSEKIPVRIIKPNSFKMDEVEQLDSFPNLLGMDFLEKGYKFFCDLKGARHYFERD